MPNIKSAKKRVKTNKRDTLKNKHYKSMLKTKLRNVQDAIEAGEKNKVQDLLKDALRTIGRVEAKGIIHKNNAARKKSRLVRRVNAFLGSSSIQPSEPNSSASAESSPSE